MPDTSLSAFTLKDINGRDFPLAQFAGRPVVIANTASACGFTPQYAGLQQLWHDRRHDGLVVIGVPSNDFGGQEPGDHAAISTFCERNFGVDFPLTERVHVTGDAANPLFKWLGAEAGFLGRPRWNFYKYLIGRDGLMKDWFATPTAPGAGRFQRAIDLLIAQ